MKKIIVLLIIVAGGLVGILTKAEIEAGRAWRENGEVIKIESVFKRDEQVNTLIEHINSVREKNYDKGPGNIVAERNGGVVTINVWGADQPKYYEEFEKIERMLELEGLVDFIYNEEILGHEKELLEGLEE